MGEQAVEVCFDFPFVIGVHCTCSAQRLPALLNDVLCRLTHITPGTRLSDVSTVSGIIWTKPCGERDDWGDEYEQAVLPPVVQHQAAMRLIESVSSFLRPCLLLISSGHFIHNQCCRVLCLPDRMSSSEQRQCWFAEAISAACLTPGRHQGQLVISFHLHAFF